MIRFLGFTFVLIVFISCHGKKKKAPVPADQFFPVPAYVKGELAKMDKSLATFLKIETIDGKADTVPIKNVEAKQYASDFAALPDIGSDELRDDYEVTKAYDDILGSYVFMFTTNEDHPVRREDVVLDPALNEQGKNDIQSIFVELWQNKGDTAVRKNMLWEAGKNFQITTITEAGGAQKTKKLQIVWNGFESQNH